MLFHQHKRKRILKKIKGALEFPHPDPKIRFLDNLVVLVSIVSPISAIPQIYKIWAQKQVEGISFLSWFIWFVLNLILLLYGIVHKEKRLVILWGLWLVMYVLILSGLIIFR